MKNKLRILHITWCVMIVLIILQGISLSSCGNKLHQLIDAQNNQDYCHFEYVDMRHIKATAKMAIWLSDGSDTVLLNPKEFILLELPDDEYNVSVGNGNDDVMSFTF